MKTMLKMTILIVIISAFNAQNITMMAGGESIPMVTNGSLSQDFYAYKKEMDCGMPELYIFPDATHNNYIIETEGC